MQVRQRWLWTGPWVALTLSATLHPSMRGHSPRDCAVHARQGDRTPLNGPRRPFEREWRALASRRGTPPAHTPPPSDAVMVGWRRGAEVFAQEGIEESHARRQLGSARPSSLCPLHIDSFQANAGAAQRDG